MGIRIQEAGGNPPQPATIPTRQLRRAFSDIRLDLLRALSPGRSTVNDLSRRTNINWRTVDNHLVYLCGRGWAEKVFDSPYVKIFDITQEGTEYLAKMLARQELNSKKKQVRAIQSRISETVLYSTGLQSVQGEK